MRIGILTGGGDVPGLNPCIKAVVNRVADRGPRRHRNSTRLGGSCRNTTRTTPPRRTAISCTSPRPSSEPSTEAAERCCTPRGPTLSVSGDQQTSPTSCADQVEGDGPHDLTDHVLRVLEDQKLDVLIPIGGDDTLSYGQRLHEEGFPVIAIPKTMDNDVHGTEYCIGFSTAVTRGVQFITNLRTSTGSHERIAVVELFGRNSGETSLVTAYLSGVDRSIISEVPFDIDRLSDFLVADRAKNPSKYAILTISEGAQLIDGDIIESGESDAYGHRKLGGIGALTAELIKERTGIGIIEQRLGYLMRSGSPDSLDLMVAINFAVMAAELAMEGATGRMVALRGGTYTAVPISVTKEGVKRVDVDELYDRDAYRPKVRHVTGKPMFLY